MKRIAALLAAIALVGTARAETLKDICGDCTFEKYASCGEFLEGINFDKQGHAWAVGLMSGAIIEVVDGKCGVRAKTGGKPNGARFHADGRLFVTDQQRGVLTFDPRTNAITIFADKIDGKPMVNANDLVFDDKGGLYVTVPGTSSYLDHSGQLIYFAPGSSSAKVVADKLPYPNGVAIEADSQFVNVGLYGDKTIVTIPSATNPGTPRTAYAAVRTEGGIGPDGMARDSEGRIYWANFFSGAIGVTDTRGFVLGYAKLPDDAGRFTTNLAFYKGYLYLTEASKGEIWRVKVSTTGQALYYQP
ncbi:SMP-30/gluconolactonase/LRE family protein [Sphingobium nicotianae]|uniref:SMP-30/gluconolactonase/LRE family protein n=1 Tax=Sphingobium nicotianae TaxID=2782607 RepID=A0A9X1ISD7_9SPHN|nr:SMP-30/gluconolactonase/LRE family protein [Sphingobium nicotianae]MBT2188307.1 SMP-30/gluconolactonase/LRE family protein [Sphingobium nicotianae]